MRLLHPALHDFLAFEDLLGAQQQFLTLISLPLLFMILVFFCSEFFEGFFELFLFALTF